MSVKSKAVSVSQEDDFGGVNQLGEPRQFARHSLLARVPGLIFGLMTLVYVVSVLWMLG
jgi:hypothetical protein